MCLQRFCLNKNAPPLWCIPCGTQSVVSQIEDVIPSSTPQEEKKKGGGRKKKKKTDTVSRAEKQAEFLSPKIWPSFELEPASATGTGQEAQTGQREPHITDVAPFSQVCGCSCFWNVFPAADGGYKC